jgi:hypothetical protein
MAKTDDLSSGRWERHAGNPIVPLQGFDWHWLNHNGHLRNARDPHVVEIDGIFLLTYTAMHRSGCPAVGGLVSEDLESWRDIGPVLFRRIDPAPFPPESVSIFRISDKNWVLFASQSPGVEYYLSADPFSWHGSEAKRITYLDGKVEAPAGLELLARDDDSGQWLVAFFENQDNRMFVGILDRREDPWTIRRARDPMDVQGWIQ